MLKIPEDGKLIDAGQLYRYADGEYQAIKAHHGADELVRFAENVRDIIGEMAYDLPEIEARQVIFCGKCGYYNPDTNECKVKFDSSGEKLVIASTGFCSDAKRRNDNGK